MTIDCLRYDRCGFNGHHRNTTPTLDGLATEALVFDHCYTTGPYTTESSPGILDGEHSYNGYKYGDNTACKALPPDAHARNGVLGGGVSNCCGDLQPAPDR